MQRIGNKGIKAPNCTLIAVPDRSKPDILAIGAQPEPTIAVMAESFAVHRMFPAMPDPRALDRSLSERIRGLATDPGRGASRAFIGGFPNLEIIACCGVGIETIDLAAARERGIAVTNTPGVLSAEVADLAIGLLIASWRRIVAADRYVRDGRWTGNSAPLGRSLAGKTMGIVGLGGIGRAIAERAVAFGMSVLYHGPRPKPDAPYRYVASLADMARASDVLIVACKGGPETHKLVSAEILAALGPKGTVVNIARGSVIDETALIAALESGALAGAALDVMDNEPNVSAALLALPNVIVQPHHGSATIETRTRMGLMVVDNLRAHFERRPLPSRVA